MRKLALLLIAAASLAGCVDHGKCLQSHLEHHDAYMLPITSFLQGPNGSMTPVTTYTWIPEGDDTVCDTWEFPDGRPAHG